MQNGIYAYILRLVYTYAAQSVFLSWIFDSNERKIVNNMTLQINTQNKFVL